MTPPHSLLIFDLDDTRFGVDAALVRESVWLPELTPVEEVPPFIPGIFSLRGQIVTVTDLNLRFGRPVRPYRLNDQIVILELDQLLMGLIVSEAREVAELSVETIQSPPKFDDEKYCHDCLVAGEVRMGDDIVMLLDTSELMRLPRPHPSLTPQKEGKDGNVVEDDADLTSSLPQADEGFEDGYFCSQATPEERAIYRARARALMETPDKEEGANLPLAVVELGGEYFGVELDTLQEFCDVSYSAPIPCCPPHILGAMSLRGNLLTLLDLRSALNLSQTQQDGNKVAMIARFDGQALGVAVDEVCDVVYLRQKELQAAPAALRQQHGTEVKGTTHYAGKVITVLDLPALLAREEWKVNESV